MWFTKLPEYIEWSSATSSAALFLVDPFADGKTSLARALAVELVDKHDDRAVEVAYVSCIDSKGSSLRILRSILSQLILNNDARLSYATQIITEYFPKTVTLKTLLEDKGETLIAKEHPSIAEVQNLTLEDTESTQGPSRPIHNHTAANMTNPLDYSKTSMYDLWTLFRLIISNVSTVCVLIDGVDHLEDRARSEISTGLSELIISLRQKSMNVSRFFLSGQQAAGYPAALIGALRIDENIERRRQYLSILLKSLFTWLIVAIRLPEGVVL